MLMIIVVSVALFAFPGIGYLVAQYMYSGNPTAPAVGAMIGYVCFYVFAEALSEYTWLHFFYWPMTRK